MSDLKMENRESGVRKLIFNVWYTLQESQITNRIVLLVLELLELLTLHYFYINPIYTHIDASPTLQNYFSSIFPNLYFLSQSEQAQGLPILLLIYSISFIGLLLVVIARITIAQPVLHMVFLVSPLLILRAGSEIVELGKDMRTGGSVLAVLYWAMALLTLIMMGISLGLYDKLLKITDLVMAILLFCNIHPIAMLCFLSLKLLLSSIVLQRFPLPPLLQNSRTLKLYFEASLLFSLLLLFIIPDNTINYIMLMAAICSSLLNPSFQIYLALRKNDLSETVCEEEEEMYAGVKEGCYRADELDYLRKVEGHIRQCQELHCLCRTVVQVADLSELKAWRRKFTLNQSQILSQRAQSPTHFRNLISHALLCLKISEGSSMKVLRSILKMTPGSLQEQYLRYKCIRNFQKYLDKNNPESKIFSGKREDNNPVEEIMSFENRVSFLVKKMKGFWEQVAGGQGKKAETWAKLYEISDDIIWIEEAYHSFEQNYDDKGYADFYYSIFSMLTRHEKVDIDYLSQIHCPIIMISQGLTITNATLNLQPLLEKTREQIISKSISQFIPRMYRVYHKEWCEDFTSNYSPSQTHNYLKTILVDNGFGGGDSWKIKTVSMTHYVMLDFEHGLRAVTEIQESREHINKAHVLIGRENLEILGFEEHLLKLLKINNLCSPSEMMKLTLKELFPNIREELILNGKSGAQKFKAVLNEKYRPEKKKPKSLALLASMKCGMLKQAGNEDETLFSEVPSQKNNKLGIILLCFQNEASHEFVHPVGSLQHKETEAVVTLKRINSINSQQAQEKSEDEEKPQKEKQGSLTWEINALLWILFLVFLAMAIWVLVQFERAVEEAKKSTESYQQSFNFLYQVSKTELFFLDFPQGHNYLSDLRNYWQNHENHYGLVTIFEQLDEQLFHNIFVSRVIEKTQITIFNQIEGQVEKSVKYIGEKKLQVYLGASLGMAALITMTVLGICRTTGVESKMRGVLKLFFEFRKKDIKVNIERIQDLESLLGIRSGESLEAAESDQESGEAGSRDFYLMRSNRYEIRAEATNVRLKTQNICHDDDEVETESYMQEDESESCRSNAVLVLPSFITCFLGLGLLALPLTLGAEAMESIKTSSQMCFKTSLGAMHGLFIVKEIYFEDISTPLDQPLTYYFYQSTEDLQKLPDFYASLQQQHLEFSEQSVCNFITSKPLIESCLQHSEIFKSGLTVTLQYIEEVFRKVQMQHIDKSFFQEDNELAFALKVSENVQYQFWSDLQQRYREYLEEIQNACQILRFGVAAIFAACFLLTKKGINMIESKMKKTENLFKIVPPFMKASHNSTHIHFDD